MRETFGKRIDSDYQYVQRNIPDSVVFADEEILYPEKEINIRNDISQSDIKMEHQENFTGLNRHEDMKFLDSLSASK